jgi:hypothetical protein
MTGGVAARYLQSCFGNIRGVDCGCGRVRQAN